MVARLLPGIGIFFGHLDLSCEIQDGECRGDQLDHIGDGGDGQTKDDGDDADDIHEGQDVGAGTALVFLAEALGQPAIITGLTDGDGVVGKAGVQGGKQSHDGAADDEEVEQPGGEDALSSEYQGSGVAVLFHAHYANACHGNANIQDAQGGHAEQQDKGDILAGILGVTAISSGHVVALGGVDEQQDCTEEAAADLTIVEGDAPAIDGKVGVAEIEDGQLHLEDTDDRKEDEGCDQKPSHHFLCFCHDVNAHQVDDVEEGQQRNAHNDPCPMGVQGRDDVAQVSGSGCTEQRERQALGEVHVGENAGCPRTGQIAQHGVVASAQTQSGRDENERKDHDKSHQDRHEIRQPCGVTSHFDGRDDQSDDACTDDLADGQCIELGPTEGTWFWDGFFYNVNRHGDSSFSF